MEYRISLRADSTWQVHGGTIVHGDWVLESTVFFGSIADCYAWVKAKQEGLIL